MPNQYDKVTLYIESDDIIDETLLCENLSIAVIDSIKNILPKDTETIDLLINKIKDEL